MALSAEDVVSEPGVAADTESEIVREGEVAVVLVSFLRDWAFWRGEGTRAVGRLQYSFFRLSKCYELKTKEFQRTRTTIWIGCSFELGEERRLMHYLGRRSLTSEASRQVRPGGWLHRALSIAGGPEFGCGANSESHTCFRA